MTTELEKELKNARQNLVKHQKRKPKGPVTRKSAMKMWRWLIDNNRFKAAVILLEQHVTEMKLIHGDMTARYYRLSYLNNPSKGEVVKPMRRVKASADTESEGLHRCLHITEKGRAYLLQLEHEELDGAA